MIDTTSATWASIEDYLNERLKSLREKNDTELSEQQTARIRGQIAEVKSLLLLPKTQD